jgi:hypothetical protein
MRHEQGGDFQLEEPVPQLSAQLFPRGSVECGERFIEQEQARPAGQRPSERYSLLLPA